MKQAFATLFVAGLCTAVAAQDTQPRTPEPAIAFATTPSQPVSGDNTFEVTVTGADGKPVLGADVSVLLVMPAMPSMGMPEMRNTITLKAAEGKVAEEGRYIGRGQVPMPGRWNVTVSVKVNGKDFAQKKLTLSAM